MIPPPSHEDLQLRARVPKMRIVVDAGHGGWDLGTVGKRGLLEKDWCSRSPSDWASCSKAALAQT